MTSLFDPGDRNVNRTPYMDLNQSRDSLYINSNSTTNPASQPQAQSTPQTYPPPHNEYNPSYYASNTALKHDFPGREHGRTPSPTPSEAEELMRKHVIDWKRLRSWRFWFRREWLWYYVAFVIILIVVILITVYDKQIVGWLEPTGQKIRALPAGFLIPIAIFFVISFPPLFGQEILAILCGLVWGLWVGFAIVAAGTYLGELGNFFAFKYCCRARGEKLEKSKIMYACLAKIVREGGFRIALIARYSAIPGHFTTAIFSTCGMSVLVFSAAAILSLPKQFITVYVGVVLEQSGTGTATTKNRIIEDVVLAITIIITGLAMWYIYKKMNEVKPDVIYERRKARQLKLESNLNYPPPTGPYHPQSTALFNPANSDSTLPLNPTDAMQHQQWDEYGRAIGYVGDPRLQNPSDRNNNRSGNIVAPTPLAPGRVPTFRTEGGGGFSADGRRYSSSSSSESPVPHGAAVAYQRVGEGDRTLPVQQQQDVSARPYGYGQSRDRRQESVDSVGWDMNMQNDTGGVWDTEAYKVPVISFNSGVDDIGERTPRGLTTFAGQQQSYIDRYTDPYQSSSTSYPPFTPPPQQQKQQYVSPIGPPPQRNVQQSVLPSSYDRASSPAPTITFNQPLQSPFDPPSNTYTIPQTQTQLQGHQLFPSTSSALSDSSYYTATPDGTHSRMGTDDPLISNSNPNISINSARSPIHSPPRQQTFSPPPPSYRSNPPL